MRPRLIRILAVTYLVKTLLIAMAWILVPDLPDRAKAAWRATFASETQ